MTAMTHNIMPLLAIIVGVALLVILVAGIRAELRDAIELDDDGWPVDWPEGMKR